MQAPLSAMVGGLELLLRKAQQWDAVADEGATIAPELRPLSGLIIRWRKLEVRHDRLCIAIPAGL